MTGPRDRKKYELAIVILTYNVKELLVDCLQSVMAGKTKKDNWQIIVADNASSDGSREEIAKKFPEVKYIYSEKNLGFAGGNDLVMPEVSAEYVLFLNPDTVVIDKAISKSLEFIKTKPEIGALTCRVDFPNGQLDYSCHRGLPTPWNALCYFSGLAKLFPKWGLVSGYTATHLNLKTIHEIECGNGTFFLVRWTAGQQVGWWDKDYFWNGEDVEFCFSLREKGWKIFFYPEAKIIHYKGSSSGLWKTAKKVVPLEVKMRAAKAGISAMRIFYEKHYLKKSPWVMRKLVGTGITLLESYRLAKIKMELK